MHLFIYDSSKYLFMYKLLKSFSQHRDDINNHVTHTIVHSVQPVTVMNIHDNIM